MYAFVLKLGNHHHQTILKAGCCPGCRGAQADCGGGVGLRARGGGRAGGAPSSSGRTCRNFTMFSLGLASFFSVGAWLNSSAGSTLSHLLYFPTNTDIGRPNHTTHFLGLGPQEEGGEGEAWRTLCPEQGLPSPEL